MKLITRRLARFCTLQALYSWKLTNNDINLIEQYIVVTQNIQSCDISYFHRLYVGIIECIVELENLIRPYLNRNFKSVDYVECLILLIAVFELTRCFDVPYKVIVNEAIELAKIFGSETSHKFINGVLDRVATNILCRKNTILYRKSKQGFFI